MLLSKQLTCEVWRHGLRWSVFSSLLLEAGWLLEEKKSSEDLNVSEEGDAETLLDSVPV